jgi:hypothetical protein
MPIPRDRLSPNWVRAASTNGRHSAPRGSVSAIARKAAGEIRIAVIGAGRETRQRPGHKPTSRNKAHVGKFWR